MIDLTTRLPNAITANGNLILLNTDYRIWIRFYSDLQNDGADRDISYLFESDVPFIDDEVYTQLMMFLYNPSVTPKSSGGGSDKVLDYLLDGEYIFSALYQTYGIDIVEMDMHWHKFQALCTNIIGDSTLWGYAKQSRGYEKPSKNDTQDKIDSRAKLAWSFPIVLTEEQQKLSEEFDDYFD